MFYECILLIRPDVSLKHIKTIVNNVRDLAENGGGKSHGGEYWGFRTLAYRIEKRAKGHYVCLGLELSSLKEIEHHLKFHKDLLRFIFIKKPDGLEFPTPLFHSSLDDIELVEEGRNKEELNESPLPSYEEGENE